MSVVITLVSVIEKTNHCKHTNKKELPYSPGAQRELVKAVYNMGLGHIVLHSFLSCLQPSAAHPSQTSSFTNS